MKHELCNGSWLKALQQMSTSEQVYQFVDLWVQISQVQLQPGVSDSILWKWSASGDYTAKSADEIQFQGSLRFDSASMIWKARTENKCRFFSWLLLQEKILTADKLAIRGWPCI